MTEITSANPDDLDGFVSDGSRLRVPLHGSVESLRALQSSVVAGCDGAHQIAPAAVNQTSGVLFSMALNENMVAGVRNALLGADAHADGTRSMDTNAVVESLAAAGVTQNLGPIHVEPGVFLGVPPTSGFVDDPICAANGNFVELESDLVFPGWSAVLDVVRTHNSLASGRIGAFGAGWTSVLDLRVVAGVDGVVRVHLADGAVVPFLDSGDGVLRSVGARKLWLEAADGGGWLLHEGPTKAWCFDSAGTFTGGTSGAATLSADRDSAGRVVALSEVRSGRSVEFIWSQDRVAVARSSDGRRVRYFYNHHGVLVRVERPSGAVSYEVDGTRIVSVTDADGVRLAHNVYDADGRVLEQTNELGRTTRYEYSPLGTTLVSDTVEGPRNAFTHDDRGNLTSLVDGNGHAMRVTYDTAGNATKVVDRTGAITERSFDARGNLTSRTDPDGLGQRWEWDTLDRLVAEEHRNGEVTRYSYEGTNRRPSKITDPDGATTTVEVDPELGLPVAITDADGVTTRYSYDRDGQMTSMVDALGGETTFAYDRAGLVVGTIDAAGGHQSIVCDEGGRPLEVRIGDDATRFAYTAAGRPLTGTDPEGQAWSAQWGTNGRLETFTDAEGSTVGYEWDLFANLETVIAPDGARFGHVYDKVNNLIGAFDSEGNTSQLKRDGEGRVIEAIDPAGRTWRRDLDILGRTIVSVAPDGARTAYEYSELGAAQRVVHPDGHSVSIEHDRCGRVTAVVDETAARYEFTYTPAGRLAERRWPSGRVERFSYDPAGRQIATEAVGFNGQIKRSEFELDAMGRAVAVEGPDGRSSVTLSPNGDLLEINGPHTNQHFDIDRSGRVTASTDGDGAATGFDWDRAGRLVSATDPAGLSTQLTYDVRGRLASQISPTGESTDFSYDPIGRLAAITDAGGATTSVQRDPSGIPVAMDRADGTRIESTLDAFGRVVATSIGGEADQAFTHDPRGRLSEAINMATGVHTAIERDAAGRVVGVNSGFGSLEGERDRDGLVSSWSQNGQRTGIVRDPWGRIESFQPPTGDAIAGPSTPDRERDAADRITSDGHGNIFRYDPAGRLIESLSADGTARYFRYGADGLLSAELGPDGEVSYERGFLGRIEAINRPDGSRTTINYDSLGRRTRLQGSDGSLVLYRWDDHDNLIALSITQADRTETGHRITPDAFGRPVAFDGTPILWDDLRTGLPIQIGDQPTLHLNGRNRGPGVDGSWSQPGEDPWGSDDNPDPHVGFEGHFAAAGLVWMGARVYDPATREFLSPDPLLAVPGMPGASSVYSYGFLNPVNYLDPSGLRPVSQQEFDAWRESEEQGRLGQAWQAIQDDPWGTLAMVGVTALGVALVATGVGTAVGVGILVGVGMSAGIGLATGNFSPTDVAIGGALGAIPGGASLRGAVLVGAGTGFGGELATQAIKGEPIDIGAATQQGMFGAIGGAATHGIMRHIGGAQPAVELDTPPTLTPRGTPGGGTSIVKYDPYPPAATSPGGFVGKPVSDTLQPGSVISRYGSEGGRYTSPAGTPFSARGLPPGQKSLGESVYQVTRPIDVDAGIAAWWQGGGGGIQYRLPASVRELLESGALKRVGS